GDNLAAWCRAAPRSWREIVDAYVQAARGLAAAHRAGLVHRDFKPSNALIDGDGVVQVTDFGLVRAADQPEREPGPPAAAPAGASARPRESAGALQLSLTRTGAVVGTPAYMAPEQHAGEAVDARTDQWALACSLYEALHGDRPVPGDSYEEIAAAAQSGTMRPEPSDSAVPRSIRGAIRRALSRRPADRFASMDELIAALSPPLHARRWWIAGLAGAAAAIIAPAIALTLFPRGGDEVTCTGLDAPLAAIWNRARAGALTARFASAGTGYTVDSAHRALGGLDAYGAEWLAARRRACTDARDGQSSSERLDRRMRCLDRRLVEMSALIGALLQADPVAIRGAGTAIGRLNAVSDCADPRETVPRPSDAQARARIAAAEDDLARGWAFHALGECERALPLARGAAEVGERTGWSPLRGRALVLRGECENRQGDYQASVATLDGAATEAARAQDDALIAEALADRFYVLGDRLGKPADALKGRRYIELALERAGRPPRPRAIWLHVLAIVLLNQGKVDEALAAQTEAIRIWRQISPPGGVNLIDSLQTQANIQLSRGEFVQARALLDEVMTAEVSASGPEHPRVAAALTNMGVLEVHRGDMPAAIDLWIRALDIQRRSGISDWIATYNLGLAEATVGRWRDARATLVDALAAAEAAAPGDSLPVAACASALGALLVRLGALDQADALIARAVRAGGAAGDVWLAEALTSSARLALARDDVAAARTTLDRAARVAEPDDASVALLAAEVARGEKGCRGARAAYEHVLSIAGADEVLETNAAAGGLGECLVELGDAAGAVARLEPRVAWLEEARADPAAVARMRFALARALAGSGGDRVRARSLAESARAGFADLGAPGERHAAEVASWLKRR
ncbi:MAG TPA: serine/threonine-protein kinase, partial [Kofleriaceae bacterium]|nr:serine/threonine-protein kinase [Kofleriaceae bacterium]